MLRSFLPPSKLRNWVVAGLDAIVFTPVNWAGGLAVHLCLLATHQPARAFFPFLPVHFQWTTLNWMFQSPSCVLDCSVSVQLSVGVIFLSAFMTLDDDRCGMRFYFMLNFCVSSCSWSDIQPNLMSIAVKLCGFICIKTTVILRKTINEIIFKWVYHRPAATCTSSPFQRLLPLPAVGWTDAFFCTISPSFFSLQKPCRCIWTWTVVFGILHVVY